MKSLKNDCTLSDEDKKKLADLLRRKISDIEFEFKPLNKELKNKLFMHMDITPYDDLLPDSKDYDRAIVSNIIDVEN